MANSNYANSVLPNAVIRLEDIFTGQNGRYVQYNNLKSEAIKMVNDSQTARMTEVFAGGRCIGIQMNWLKNCTALGGFATQTLPTACAIPTGIVSTSDVQTINPLDYFEELAELDDNLCSNEYVAEELLAERLADAISRLDIRMNRYTYAQLLARTFANQDPNTIGTVVSNRTTIPASSWTSDILVQLELEAMYNGLGNYMILDSRNLLAQKNLSQYRSLNDNERNQAATFNAWDSRLIFDSPRDIAGVTGRASTFIVDMDMVALVNRTSYTSLTPELLDSADNFYTFQVTSPRTGVRYDVEYQKSCTARDEVTNRYYKHKFRVKFLGGIVFAPAQCDSVTGVMEYVKV